MVLVHLVSPQSKRAGLERADVELFFPEANGLELDDEPPERFVTSPVLE